MSSSIVTKTWFAATLVVLILALSQQNMLPSIDNGKNTTYTTTTTITIIKLPAKNDSTEQPEKNLSIDTNQNMPQVPEYQKLNENEKKDIEKILVEKKYVLVSFRTDNETETDKVLLALPPTEYYLEYRSNLSPEWATVNITDNGFEWLIKNPNVKKIIWAGRQTTPLLQNSIPLIKFDKVWKLQFGGLNITGKGQTVCVVDTGVNYTHPDLGGCPQTNDINSANCPKVIGGYDYLSNPDDSDPMDTDGHGTHVSGIIASNGSINGASPDVNLVVIRAVGGELSDAEKGIDWCINNRTKFNISIISLSFRATGNNYTSVCDGEDTVVNAANKGRANDILVVASSGNFGNTSGINSPACGSNVTSIGATYDTNVGFRDFGVCIDEETSADKIVCLTNRNQNLDLLAPGVVINSTNITTNAGNYGVKSGTSQAAPHAAGLAALMKQANNSLSPADIERIMNYTGKPIYDPATQLTFRRIDAFRSVLAVLYNLFVSDFQVVNSNAGNRIFQFKAFNDLSTAANVSWIINYGDGKSDTSQSNVSLNASQETFIFTSHDYARPGNYTITAYANSSDSSNTLSMTIEVRPIEVNTLKLLNQSSLKNIYGFNIKAPESDLNVSWVFYPKDGVAINSTQNISLTANQTIFVYFEYNYSSTGTYNVTANATDADKRYFDFNNITVNVI